MKCAWNTYETSKKPTWIRESESDSKGDKILGKVSLSLLESCFIRHMCWEANRGF